MTGVDDLDRQLLARLSADARTPAATLAAALHVSRGTVQARMARLVASGVIRRFTVELAPEVEARAVRALTTVQLSHASPRSVAAALRALPAVSALHTTNGTWDLVAELRAGTLSELDAALSDIRAIRGVANTETSILLTEL
ncbi:MAG TPA: Lrp/AsnC family transcriptional regulator [Dermatophilaceae bacterium]|nr:Lrp/AsnC family transcriptional regulator [Dermatophilaceae bacterium]